MVKLPAEIFGYPTEMKNDEIKKVRTTFGCPFLHKKCTKQSRLIKYPMGVCSVIYGKDIIALCPKRFLQEDTVFQNIADHYFKTRDNLMIFSEIGLKKIGNFDYVMVKHKPLRSEIEDFIIIEFQTGQTTSTGSLVKSLEDYMNSIDIKKNKYNFGLNYADIWKRTFTQILNKGIILENWGHKIYWVAQEQIFDDLKRRYNLENITYDEEDITVFFEYNMKYDKNKYKLINTKIDSASIDELFKAFRTNPNIPSKTLFLSKLQEKIKLNLNLKLELK